MQVWQVGGGSVCSSGGVGRKGSVAWHAGHVLGARERRVHAMAVVVERQAAKVKHGLLRAGEAAKSGMLGEVGSGTGQKKFMLCKAQAMCMEGFSSCQNVLHARHACKMAKVRVPTHQTTKMPSKQQMKQGMSNNEPPKTCLSPVQPMLSVVCLFTKSMLVV